MRILSIVMLMLLTVSLHGSRSACGAESERLVLNDGDRVLWLGGTVVEREQIYGYWETMLSASFADRDVKFRNLGWSGDTVWSESRGMFDAPAKGYERMLAMVVDFKPTVIIYAYGGNEAFTGERGLEPFLTQYRKLINDLKPTGARPAFLLPLDIEVAATPVKAKAEKFNAEVVPYRTAIRKLAEELKAPVIDLSRVSKEESAIRGQTLTTDGLQFTAVGYWATAHRLRDQVEATRPGVELPLPSSPFPPEPSPVSADRLEKMRTAIIAKNELFFHRWRPQNFTYLFGFRKHEQGNNAVEIPQFDPLVAKQEEVIAGLRAGN